VVAAKAAAIMNGIEAWFTGQAKTDQLWVTAAEARGHRPAFARDIGRAAPSSVFAALKPRRTHFALVVLAGSATRSLGAKRGGHDRDRTCDPYHVKVVLSR
jgi:hypothetical protein